MNARFEGKVVLVTGGASGIGRAAAVRFATEGARLALVDIDSGGLAGTAAEIERAAPGTEVLLLTADVSDEAATEYYVGATREASGRIDAFFNNAGIEGEQQHLTEDCDSAEFQQVVAVNLRGVFFGLKHVLAVMRAQGGGRVVSTASVGGIRGVGNQAGYAAAKHGVVGLTRNAGVEYGRYGITVNAVAPGAIMTPMAESWLKEIDPENWEEAGRQFVSANPTRRFGRPEEVAGLVAYLLSDEASFVNATVVAIDGGQSDQY